MSTQSRNQAFDERLDRLISRDQRNHSNIEMENRGKSNQEIVGDPEPVFGNSTRGKSQQMIGGKILKDTPEDLLRSKPLPPENEWVRIERNERRVI